jgi:hypothetical protein
MCPVCLATTGLYLASGISGGAASSFLVARWMRRRPNARGRESQEKRNDNAQDRNTQRVARGAT